MNISCIGMSLLEVDDTVPSHSLTTKKHQKAPYGGGGDVEVHG
jgi:hypothetical protein